MLSCLAKRMPDLLAGGTHLLAGGCQGCCTGEASTKIFFSSFSHKYKLWLFWVFFCFFLITGREVRLPTSTLILQYIYDVKSGKSSALLRDIHSNCIGNGVKKLTTWWSEQTRCAHWARAVKGNIREWNSSNSNGIKLAFQIMLQLLWIWNNWCSHFNGFLFFCQVHNEQCQNI